MRYIHCDMRYIHFNTDSGEMRYIHCNMRQYTVTLTVGR